MKGLIKSRAFSLPDFMLSASLMALLLYLSVPKMSQINEALKVKSEAKKLRAHMQEQQLQAVRGGGKVSVVLHPAFYELRDKNAKVYSTIFLKAPIKLLVSQSGRELVFYPSGVMTPATLKFSGRYKECSVVASLRGRVRIRC
jgi:type II secretory pathway pseudopilin PulG